MEVAGANYHQNKELKQLPQEKEVNDRAGELLENWYTWGTLAGEKIQYQPALGKAPVPIIPREGALEPITSRKKVELAPGKGEDIQRKKLEAKKKRSCQRMTTKPEPTTA